MHILLTRPLEDSKELILRFSSLGHNVSHLPVIKILEKINDNQSRVIANAERNILKILEGDCDTAVGVYAKISKDIVNIKAELFSVDGKQRFYVDESENEKMINELSIKIGEKLKSESKGSYKR